ncbi:MAG: hypothetical protein HOK21_09710 [Rhodospirillaceae bacterium]|jgi:hypothetical protein|nr:hypothetical protein [Rhodospirillaceae bacterium]MBT4044998.1 hypothetical protein [Rhodospirillaceae bacterium]MBT5082908.1 hypothetical protein [Rhodospirillaceae bacterium]MBT5524352.1 hypothetical protein [Rhodospirillaceae bacterium]MBT5878852.1 hypothetical protein [Rhodospirillaceae bacterium]
MIRHLVIIFLLSLISDIATAASNNALRAYYETAPNCIVVLDGPMDAGIAGGQRIAAALARQLSGRVDRVIHPLERRRLVRAMAVDLEHPGDARHFAAATRCPAFLRWQVLGAGHDNALIWSQKYISIGAEIIRARDGTLLWQSHANASRNSGDVPLSLFSLPIALFRAAEFQNDDDAVASMLDDLARRMLASLPDLR